MTTAPRSPSDRRPRAWVLALLTLITGPGALSLTFAVGEGGGRGPGASTSFVLSSLFLAAIWTLGGLAVIGGTVLGAPLLVDAGGALLVVTMVLMLRAVGRRAQGPAWLLWVFRAALVLTAVSIPVGLVLAHLRAA